MKIKSGPPNNPVSLVTQDMNNAMGAQNRQGAVAQQNQTAKEQPKGDTVKLSSRSKMIAKAKEVVTQTPDIRTEKVSAIKTQVEAGTYQVSAETVADSILKKRETGFI